MIVSGRCLECLRCACLGCAGFRRKSFGALKDQLVLEDDRPFTTFQESIRKIHCSHGGVLWNGACCVSSCDRPTETSQRSFPSSYACCQERTPQHDYSQGCVQCHRYICHPLWTIPYSLGQLFTLLLLTFFSDSDLIVTKTTDAWSWSVHQHSQAGKVQISLLIPNTKVAPIKWLTIPQLEFCGAYLSTITPPCATSVSINTSQLHICLDWQHYYSQLAGRKLTKVQDLCQKPHFLHCRPHWS